MEASLESIENRLEVLERDVGEIPAGSTAFQQLQALAEHVNKIEAKAPINALAAKYEKLLPLLESTAPASSFIDSLQTEQAVVLSAAEDIASLARQLEEMQTLYSLYVDNRRQPIDDMGNFESQLAQRERTVDLLTAQADLLHARVDETLDAYHQSIFFLSAKFLAHHATITHCERTLKELL